VRLDLPQMCSPVQMTGALLLRQIFSGLGAAARAIHARVPDGRSKRPGRGRSQHSARAPTSRPRASTAAAAAGPLPPSALCQRAKSYQTWRARRACLRRGTARRPRPRGKPNVYGQRYALQAQRGEARRRGGCAPRRARGRAQQQARAWHCRVIARPRGATRQARARASGKCTSGPSAWSYARTTRAASAGPSRFCALPRSQAR